MKKIENIHFGAVMCSPFYDIMALLRMSGCLEGVSYEQTA